MNQLSTEARIKRYATNLKHNKVILASQASKDIGTRGITVKIVASVFRVMDEMEFIPLRKGKCANGKWRRK
jgi:hypothetical protein